MIVLLDLLVAKVVQEHLQFIFLLFSTFKHLFQIVVLFFLLLCCKVVNVGQLSMEFSKQSLSVSLI